MYEHAMLLGMHDDEGANRNLQELLPLHIVLVLRVRSPNVCFLDWSAYRTNGHHTREGTHKFFLVVENDVKRFFFLLVQFFSISRVRC